MNKKLGSETAKASEATADRVVVQTDSTIKFKALGRPGKVKRLDRTRKVRKGDAYDAEAKSVNGPLASESIDRDYIAEVVKNLRADEIDFTDTFAKRPDASNIDELIDGSKYFGRISTLERTIKNGLTELENLIHNLKETPATGDNIKRDANSYITRIVKHVALIAANAEAHDAQFINDLEHSLATEFPELSAMDAVLKLRREFRGEPEFVVAPYPGRHLNPFEYLRDTYRVEIQSGLLTPGQLQKLDRQLYVALRDGLSDPVLTDGIFDGEAPESVSGVFFRFGAPIDRRERSKYQARAKSCGDILDAPPEEAAQFFSRMRQDRVR